MIYTFNSFTVNTEDYVFSDGSGNKPLEPLVFDTLVHLIENRDRIVTKDELIEKLWSGRVVTDSAVNTCIRSIRKALGDSREKQIFIRTFPKRGFQFVANIEHPIPNKDVDGTENTDSRVAPNTRKYYSWGRYAPFAIIFIAIIGYGLANWHHGKNDKSLSPKPVIAVLDFTTALQEENQQHFSEGLTEELVSSLSLYRELFVIARNSSTMYRASDKNINEIGRELGAQYMVSGTTRNEGSRISVSAKLIDTNTGQHIWSDDFDSDKQGLFTLQRDLAYLIAGQIVPELTKIDFEKNNKKAPDVMDAWALYHQARVRQSIYTKEDQIESIKLAELALVKDPNLAAAYGVIARAKGVLFFIDGVMFRALRLNKRLRMPK